MGFFFIYVYMQNTIEGRLVYAPIVGRLHCGSTYVDPKGYWEMDGFGLMSIYKSDWVRFKGKQHQFSVERSYI